jgi:acetolactate synthase small subunit
MVRYCSRLLLVDACKLDAAEMMLDKYGITEMVRTGKVIMARGESGT